MKKYIKQFGVLLTALSLLVSLCACASSGTETPDSTTQPTTEPTTTAAPTTTEAPTEENEVSFGTVSGNTYENSFIGLTCTLDDEWYIYTKEEVAAVSGIASDVLTEADLQNQLKTTGNVMDFYAAKDSGLTTVNITISDNGMTLGSVANEQVLVEAMLPTLESTYTSVGYEIDTLETESVEFAGSTHPCIVLTGEYGGLPIYMRQVFLLVDTYSVAISFCSFYEDKTTETFDAFSALN